MATTTRVYVDCSEFPSEANCTLKISGTEEEVLTAAVQHAVASHGHENSSELRTMLRSGLHQEA